MHQVVDARLGDPVGAEPAVVLLDAIDEIATIAPPLPATSARAPCLIVSIVPVMLSSTVRRHASASSCVMGAMVSLPPAQATTPSRRPVVSIARATARSTSLSTVTSPATVETDPPDANAPVAAIFSAAVVSLSALRPQIVTCAPAATRSCAIPNPMPLPPPVTRTDLPVNAPASASEPITSPLVCPIPRRS